MREVNVSKENQPAFSYAKKEPTNAKAPLFVKITECRRRSLIQESLHRDLVTIPTVSHIKPGRSVHDFEAAMAMNHSVNTGTFMKKRMDPSRDQPTPEQALSLHLPLQGLNNPAPALTGLEKL